MSDLIIVAVSAEEVKHAIARYSSQADERLQVLYNRYAQYNLKYFRGELPQAIIASVEMHNKKLAHYCQENGYKLPNAVEFNRNFTALNWQGPTVQKFQGDERNVIEHVLLHEMIHLYLQGIKGEVYKDQQQAHGRSFLAEAKRVGIEGRGRLMACPYPVKMPLSEPTKRKLRKEQEQAHQDEPDDQEDEHEANPPGKQRKTRTNYAPQIVKLARQFQNKKLGLEDFEQKVRNLLGE